MSTATMARPRPKRNKRGPGWVPQQHGAWAMLILPYVVGAVLSIRSYGFRPVLIVLFALWMVGYFAFNAVSLWLKSRRRPRYFPPVRAYSIAAAVLVVAVVLLEPRLVEWAPLFVPLLGVGVYAAWRRDERSLLSGAVTVGAACLIAGVAYTSGLLRFTDLVGSGDNAARYVVAVMVVCFAYFFGTVLYVKTMIRERGHTGYVVASVGWHALWAALAAVGAGAPWGVEGAVRWLLVAFFAIATARAVALPVLGPMRDRVVTAKSLGIGEIAMTLALLAILLTTTPT